MNTVLDDRIVDPVDRALAGVDVAPEIDGDLGRRIRILLAMADGSEPLDIATLQALEDEAQGNKTWWVPAARLHASVSSERERMARAGLADQSLPYVFPGDLHPRMIDILACGERILPSLHVDWVRKLTDWVAPVLVEDCRSLGLWFWPVLRSLDQGRLTRPFARLSTARNLPPGGLGLGAAYCHRLGMPGDLILEHAGPIDSLVAALAIEGDARSVGEMG